MTKEELRSLTIEQLNGMTEEQLDVVANQVIELLEEDEIKQLPKEVRNKLKISRDRKSTRLNSSHLGISRMPSSA